MNKLPNLVAISGHIASGKDEIANMINYFTSTNKPNFREYEHRYINNDAIILNPAYKIVKFADKLKDCICLILGCTREDLEDRDFKNTPLGEQWRRWVVYSEYLSDVGDEYYATYDSIDYFESEQAAKNYIESQTKQYGKEYWSGSIENEVLTSRRILQLLGTQGGRMVVHPNIWVNATFADYKPMMFGRIFNDVDTNYVYTDGTNEDSPEFPNWLITDCRFDNESNAIRQRDGLLIRVNRPMEQRFPEEWEIFLQEKGLMKSKIDYETQFLLFWKKMDYEFYEKLTHDSETGLDEWTDWDYVIENDGTLEDLFEKVKAIVDKETKCKKCKQELNIN